MERELTESEEKKLFLNSYLQAKRDVIRLEEQLAELKLNKLSPSAINDGMPHRSDIGDLSDYVAQVDTIEREIVDKRYARISAFQRVQRAIEAMENEREKELLTYRYLRGYGWERIAVEMGYTYRHTTRMHGTALQNFKMS